MKTFLLQFFTWWNRQTIGLRVFTWRSGVRVGEDEFGNVYYKTRKPHPLLGERRWVVYNGVAEASMIPPGWHGWMHHKVDVAPPDEEYTPRDWQKPHRPNLTGTPGAYRPQGSILTPERRPKVTDDYDAWSPGT